MLIDQKVNQNNSLHYWDSNNRQIGKILSEGHKTLSESQLYPKGSKLLMHQIPFSALQLGILQRIFWNRQLIFYGWVDQKQEIGSSSSQVILVYNSKNDDYYQNFKDPQKQPFCNLSEKQISIISTLSLKFFHMCNLVFYSTVLAVSFFSHFLSFLPSLIFFFLSSTNKYILMTYHGKVICTNVRCTRAIWGKFSAPWISNSKL